MRKHTDEELKELIKRRRNQILLHSYIYYRLFDKVISNAVYNKWAQELIDLQNDYPELSETVDHYEKFKDFKTLNGSSLPLDNNPRLEIRARQLIKARDIELEDNFTD